MEKVAVECTFSPEGVRVHRIRPDDQWLPVEQGRQWEDESGRHVLIMVPGQQAQELLLRRGTLTWVIGPASHSSPKIM
ncbi:MAG: hypothetical protein KDE09_03730 [Anaerolineales bacterium]|nr:hypothetical protein [Anaerolineales bacterium]MCB8962428.1 hypothetical protein [Ardenticatenales bacterium]MCB0004853.1 hypothetical protein [Anaerolineales bacterium]MCB0010348.1 hypothetical protein [Anaerolineales bacterium]MCB0016873.1 hypothetical protein [Anaerolineales bacterium]